MFHYSFVFKLNKHQGQCDMQNIKQYVRKNMYPSYSTLFHPIALTYSAPPTPPTRCKRFKVLSYFVLRSVL
jgi:hypothetical protein